MFISEGMVINMCRKDTVFLLLLSSAIFFLLLLYDNRKILDSVVFCIAQMIACCMVFFNSRGIIFLHRLSGFTHMFPLSGFSSASAWFISDWPHLTL